MLHIWTGGKKVAPIKTHITPALKKLGVEYNVSHLDDGVPTLEPDDTLLVLGGKALEFMQKVKVLPKNRKITSLRSKRHVVNGKSVFVTFDPTIIDIDVTKEPMVHWDVQLIARWCATGSLDPQVGEYRYVDSFEDAVAYVEANGTEEKPIPLSLDLETIGLDEFAEGVRIVSAAVTYKDNMSDVFIFPEDGLPGLTVLAQLEYLCNSKKIKLGGANLKYDARWLIQHCGVQITNQKFDTCLVGSLLDENRSNSLNAHAKEYTDMGGYDDPFNLKYDKSKMDENLKASPEDFLIYAGGDTDACQRLVPPMRRALIKDSALTQFYIRLLQPAADAFTAIEHRGVLVDQNRYDELEVEVREEMNRVGELALGLLPVHLKMKYKDDLSLGRPVIIREFMFSSRGLNLPVKMKTEKTNEASTAMEHLEMFSDNPDAKAFVDLMREYNSAKKTLTTYITGFRKHLRSDGRFHPSYLLHRGDYEGKEAGTVTGRLSAKDPAVQTIPKHTKWAKPLRSVYVPPPGMAIMKADYSQGELKVTACIANETTMIKAYKAGIDLHMKTGASVFGMDLEDALALKMQNDPIVKEIRQGGKAGNFGLIYEMGAGGFQEYARKTYGVNLTMEQVVSFIDKFFGTYTRLRPWHKNAKNFARKHGYIRSPLGRIRHLPLINSKDNEVRAKQERQAINSPVQGTLSDMTILTIAILYQRYPELWCFGMTHDEAQFYVPEDEIELWAGRTMDVMENLPLKEYFGWQPQLQFTADVEYSLTNLAECIEL